MMVTTMSDMAIAVCYKFLTCLGQVTGNAIDLTQSFAFTRAPTLFAPNEVLILNLKRTETGWSRKMYNKAILEPALLIQQRLHGLTREHARNTV